MAYYDMSKVGKHLDSQEAKREIMSVRAHYPCMVQRRYKERDIEYDHYNCKALFRERRDYVN